MTGKSYFAAAVTPDPSIFKNFPSFGPKIPIAIAIASAPSRTHSSGSVIVSMTRSSGVKQPACKMSGTLPAYGSQQFMAVPLDIVTAPGIPATTFSSATHRFDKPPPEVNFP